MAKANLLQTFAYLQTQTYKNFKWFSKELKAYYFEPTRVPYR
jgi:hypothetical protein